MEKWAVSLVTAFYLIGVCAMSVYGLTYFTTPEGYAQLM